MVHTMNLKNSMYRLFSKDARKGGPISPQEAFDEVRAERAVLVDVREADEVAYGMAEGARWLPTSEIADGAPKTEAFIRDLPKDKLVIVYCAAGVRSGRFAELLASRGFQVANLGGFDDWAAAGLPVAKKP